MNGREELVSLLQYMKNTTLNNPDITVRDERILNLDKIVTEVKQSEEWEAVRGLGYQLKNMKAPKRGLPYGIKKRQQLRESIEKLLL